MRRLNSFGVAGTCFHVMLYKAGVILAGTCMLGMFEHVIENEFEFNGHRAILAQGHSVSLETLFWKVESVDTCKILKG